MRISSKWFLAVLLTGSLWVQAQSFSDIPPGHWAREAVEYLAARGYLVGYPDGTFGGDRPVTRYELALALYRAVALRPEMVLDEEAMALLRPLLREMAEEMRQVDRQMAADAPPEPAPDLADMRARLDQLEADLAALADRDEPGQAIAEILLQVAVIRDRLEMLSSGELPEGLARRLSAFLAQAYEERLGAIERRLAALETKVSTLEQRQASHEQALSAERAAREAQGAALTQGIEEVRQETRKGLQALEASMPETHLFGMAQYRQGQSPTGTQAPEGLYFLGGTLTYNPKAKEGYEVLGGRAPGHALLGFGLMRGDEKEGYGFRGLFALSGAFGFQARGWVYGEDLEAQGELAVRNYLMPLVLFPEYSGLSLSLKGRGLGVSYRMEGHAFLTAPGGAPQQSLASQADPCPRTAYGVKAEMEIPFANFVLFGKGAYGSERAVLASCAIGSLDYGTYEVGVGHDPTSPAAIVPNLGLYLAYGGHTSSADGSPFGLSYLEGRFSYAADLGALKLMTGGFYRKFTPSGDHTALPGALPLGLAPFGEGNLLGVDGLVRLGSEAYALQVEAFYRNMAASSLVGNAVGVTPSLSLQTGDLNFRLAYSWGMGRNWDFSLPNPLASLGSTSLNTFSLEASWQGWQASARYDLEQAFGHFSVSYRYAW